MVPRASRTAARARCGRLSPSREGLFGYGVLTDERRIGQLERPGRAVPRLGEVAGDDALHLVPLVGGKPVLAFIQEREGRSSALQGPGTARHGLDAAAGGAADDLVARLYAELVVRGRRQHRRQHGHRGFGLKQRDRGDLDQRGGMCDTYRLPLCIPAVETARAEELKDAMAAPIGSFPHPFMRRRAPRR